MKKKVTADHVNLEKNLLGQNVDEKTDSRSWRKILVEEFFIFLLAAQELCESVP